MTQGFVNGTTTVFPDKIAQGRLTLSSGVPVTTADVTAAGTLYFTPYKGNQIDLYTGSTWQRITFSQVSIAVSASTSQMFDVWGYISGGALALEALAWTNDTTRATALTTQDGVYVKSGDATRRYLGSYRTTGTTLQTEDSVLKRYVWNYYNRVNRTMRAVDTANSWTWSTNAYQQANANAANQLDMVIGVSEDLVYATSVSQATSSGATLRAVAAGIGLDSTTVNSAGLLGFINVNSTATALWVEATFNNTIAVGRHTLVWLEKGAGADTQTFFGDNGGFGQNGIQGFLLG